jgi:hypothetical protein
MPNAARKRAWNASTANISRHVQGVIETDAFHTNTDPKEIAQNRRRIRTQTSWCTCSRRTTRASSCAAPNCCGLCRSGLLEADGGRLDQRKTLQLLRDLLNSDYAGHRLTFVQFAHAPHFNHLAAVYGAFDFSGPLDFVRNAAGLSGRGVTVIPQQELVLWGHVRQRKFNTREAYPDQKLDNDVCMAVRANNCAPTIRSACVARPPWTSMAGSLARPMAAAGIFWTSRPSAGQRTKLL